MGVESLKHPLENLVTANYLNRKGFDGETVSDTNNLNGLSIPFSQFLKISQAVERFQDNSDVYSSIVVSLSGKRTGLFTNYDDAMKAFDINFSRCAGDHECVSTLCAHPNKRICENFIR